MFQTCSHQLIMHPSVRQRVCSFIHSNMDLDGASTARRQRHEGSRLVASTAIHPLSELLHSISAWLTRDLPCRFVLQMNSQEHPFLDSLASQAPDFPK